MEASKKEEHDLLNRSARQESFHPKLKELFRLTPYPTDGHIRDAAFSYAGVSGLPAFKDKYCPDFKGAIGASPPLLKDLLNKVCNDCGGLAFLPQAEALHHIVTPEVFCWTR